LKSWRPGDATYRIAVLPGDGIGAEVTPEAIRVLEAVGKGTGTAFEFERGLVGGAAIDATGKPWPRDARAVPRGHAILFGAVGVPSGTTCARATTRTGAPGHPQGAGPLRETSVGQVLSVLVDASPLKRQVVEGPISWSSAS